MSQAAPSMRAPPALRTATDARTGLERPDLAALRREGAQAESRTLWGEAPSEPVAVREGERRYLADVAHGQKTGFYLDQRDARELVQKLSAGKRVLDLFSYSGGFAVARFIERQTEAAKCWC